MSLEPIRAARLSDEQYAALRCLSAAIGVEGQRTGTFYQPLIRRMAEYSQSAMPEMVAALKIVEAVANGLDWDEAIQFISPEYPEYGDCDV